MSEQKAKSELHLPLGGGIYAILDLQDWDKIQGYSWHRASSRNKVEYAAGYKVDGGIRRRAYLHQLILGEISPGLEIAHRDGNGLNCRRYNMRAVTHKQNTQGPRRKSFGVTSQYRGVSLEKERRKWSAQISVDGKKLHLGRFDEEVSAARAYDAAAIKHFGEHAAPNFPAQKENQCLTEDGRLA